MDSPLPGSSRPVAGMSSFPDLMNDPAFDEREKGLDDMDTCRICHGEATEEEPLFYPCKCSGSIKFVHQSCLVEWLSHSQKKHCELCKTPFRFTKLYDPNMPQSLPTPLFLKQAIIQCFRTLVTWMRFLLVAFVWLGWLPWSMRAIWRALFWLADGRWSGIGAGQQRHLHDATDEMSQMMTHSTASINSMVSTASDAIKSAAGATPSPQLAPSNFPAGDPLMLTLFKNLIPNLFMSVFSSNSNQNDLNSNSAAGPVKTRHPSWLSDVKWLNNLTRWPTINNMIVDTAEGQLITLLVVVAFILLFLIREWVVQQQPMANIAEAEREAALQLIQVANNPPDQERAPPLEARPPTPPVHPRDEQDDPGHNDVPPRSATQSPAPSWTDSDDGLPVIERRTVHQNSFGINFHPPHAEPNFGYGTIEHDGHTPRPDMSAIQEALARGHDVREEMQRILQQEGRDEDPGWTVDEFGTLVRSENVAGPSGHQNVLEAPRASSSQDASRQNGNAILEPLDAESSHAAQDLNHALHPVDGTMPGDAPPNGAAPEGLFARLAYWFWGDITVDEHAPAVQALEDDEQVVQDPALEEPFVPVQNRPQDLLPDGAIAGAGAEPGLDANDVDAMEGDDFEGIMDLIGMQGPIFGLLQNGVFCALLIAFTVAVGIWLPYLWGKIALVLLANPLELIVGVPMTAVTVVADIALDTLIGVVGYIMYWFSFFAKLLLGPFGAFLPINEWVPQGKSFTSASLSLIDASTNRLNKVVKAFLVFHESDIPMFSVLSHQALKLHQARIFSVFDSTLAVIKFILYDFPLRLVNIGFPDALSFNVDYSRTHQIFSELQQRLTNIAQSPSSSAGAKLMSTSAAKADWASLSSEHDLAVWDTKDRVIAISMGYLLATIVGYLYLRITSFLSRDNRGQRADGIVAEILIQAGGVMKVILIIGIEMIVFPLYCGTLLDVALLPLFSNATVASRIAFTAASPLTSLFVHWFIGTCYMFHFALFVSMCRKILRTGVLYFIRDPDDPTFHPIRDVLERSITTQLRKIGFSALVYGALVIVCLGGVVWGLHYAFDGVLPIHWSANAPMLEFPVDLLFYNFVMPLALQSIKPSDGLHELYDWWFHKCAHLLRLSNFFFPERHPEEEGRHVRRTWWDFLVRRQGDWNNPVIGSEQHAVAEKDSRDVYFLRDGRYVRAPASDQVRIPKGMQVFVEVTDQNDRVDGKPDPEDGLHGRSSDMFTKVYIPPFFRTRIAAFIMLIWLFAATTGVAVTIVPLVIGRWIVSLWASSPVPVNDIYAFSCGLCAVGSLVYVLCHCVIGILAVRDHPETYLRTPQEWASTVSDALLDAGRLLSMATAVVIFLPSLFALLTELYILIPAHTMLGGGQAHVVHVIQDWTLGVLYVQMAIKLTLWHPQSWPAAVLNNIFRDGWLRPNVGLAMRALILPLSLLTTMAVLFPLALGSVLRCTFFYMYEDAQSQVYRYTYPATLLVVLAAWAIHFLLRQLAIWRINIRDDVYLIGERLHNFSEKRARDVGVSRRVITG